MKNSTPRRLLAMLGIVLLPVTLTQARPVRITEVIQVLNNSQRPAELRLESYSKHSNNLVDARVGVDGQRASDAVDEFEDSLTVAFEFYAYEQQPGVEQVNQGQVQGTICDCGDIELLAGGFPKWPLLFLGGIPFLFLGDDDVPGPLNIPGPAPTSPTPPPSPPPLNPPIPEPGSIALFVTGLSGLGIVLRRRYRFGVNRSKSD